MQSVSLPKNDPSLRNRSKFSQDLSKEFCRIKQTCGICPSINCNYQESLNKTFNLAVTQLKEQLVKTPHTILKPHASPRNIGYRASAKIAVRSYLKGTIELGLFKPNSHEIISMSDCPLHVKPIQRLLKELPGLLLKHGIDGYNEQNHSGDLRYLSLRSSHRTEETMITFVVTSLKNRDKYKTLINELKQERHHITSAHLNINDQPGNQIYGQKTVHLTIAKALRESVCDLSFNISPTSFFQVNPWQAENLYRRFEQLLGKNHDSNRQLVALDLYSGIGPLSLLLARNGYKVFALEENPQAISDLHINQQRNHCEEDITSHIGRVEDSLNEIPSWAAFPDVLVVNPSRRGLTPNVREAIDSILKNSKKRMLMFYISCNLDTLIRDLNSLSQNHQVKQLEPFDMFCQTDTFEWLAVISNR